MSAVKYIGLCGAIIAAGVTGYIMHDNHMAKITKVEPFVLHNKVAYDDCTDKKKTTYTKPGDHYNVIGGVAGGATGAIVAHAITANPVILAGGAIAGVFGGQAIEHHVKKPKAHTHIERDCVTQYKDNQTLAGYLVYFTYKNESGTRVLANKPLDKEISITLLESAPTPEQLIAKSQNPVDK